MSRSLMTMTPDPKTELARFGVKYMYVSCVCFY